MPSPQSTGGEPAAEPARAAAAEPVSGDRPTEAAPGETTHLELVEEQLEAHTRPVQVGEVLLRKEIVTETRTVEVPVQREELVVERRVLERGAGDQPDDLDLDEFSRSFAARFRALQEGETIRLPLMEEEVVVQKRPVVYEEVVIGKRRIEETQQVSGTVRREELKVARRGDIEVSHVRRTGGQGQVAGGTSQESSERQKADSPQ